LTKTIASNREFQDGLSALQAGRPVDAERSFHAVLRNEPKHLGALNLMGVVLMRRQRYAEAEHYFRRALEQYSRSDATLYNYGLVLKALNRPDEALEQFSKALKLNSSIAETWNNRGTVLNDLKRYAEAIADFDKAVTINPRYAEALYNKGKSLAVLKRNDEALADFDRSLIINPDLGEAWLGRGKLLLERKGYKQALEAFDRALALKTDLVEAWLARGDVFLGLKRWSDALVAYERALSLMPNSASAWFGSGKAFFEIRRYDDALAAYERALQLDPQFAEAWFGHATVSFEKEQFEDALNKFEKSLTFKPDLAAAWLGKGNVFLAQKRYDEAFTAFDEADFINPDLAETWLCRGNLFLVIKQFDEALEAYDTAHKLNPDLAEPWSGRGAVLSALGQYEEALAAFDRALELKPDLAEAWLGRANILYELRRYRETVAALDRALELKPNFAQAWLARGLALSDLMQFEQAFLDYHKALTLNPDLNHAEGYRLFMKLNLCDWAELQTETAQLLSHLRAGKKAAVPFALLPAPSTPADQLECAEQWVKDLPVFPAVWSGKVYVHDRIRVAYLSADFRDHAVGHLTAGLFESHDRSRFEVTGISFLSAEDTPIGQRLANGFERFAYIKDKTDGEIADLIRDLEIGIAVDLMGHTKHSRAGVFSRRPAPIQAHYMGYAGSLGSNYIDYLFADKTVVPDEHVRFYKEQIIWLPDSYLVADNRRDISPQTPTRQECGLPNDAFVFCSFNNAYKITPEIFRIWMQLLQQTPNGVLWLSQAHPTAMINLRREAEKCGVSARRLIFAPKLTQNADHLARQRRADLFLDTLPYNAHTTTSDALWGGLPVVTCLGQTFAGRVAASCLKAIGLSELITTSLEDYEALALKLASEPAFLAAIKAKLASNRDSYPLFDTPRFTRHIEAAYTTMWERYQRGERPEAFAVSPIDSQAAK
jgi:protein O-GlcNAc transferase